MKLNSFSLFLILAGLLFSPLSHAQNGGGPVEVCDDSIDNDKDGAVDCCDLDCSVGPNASVFCSERENPNSDSCQENCTDGVDNNGNDLIDCADPLCINAPNCSTNPSENPNDVPENCTNGVDDDLDGKIDAADTIDCPFPSTTRNPNLISSSINGGGSNLIGSSCNLAPLASSTGIGWLLMLGTPLAALFKKRISK